MYSLMGWNSSNIWRTSLKKQNSIQEDINSKYEVGECLLSVGAESYVFQDTKQKYKDKDM